ncbi:MAG: YggS family pyridoxal phosphate-dependent enzyme [bacterium]|nr:YggS family pyridoxal phosphate-dependent enzyme [bacterium]
MVAGSLEETRRRVAAATQRSGRNVDDVTLVAVSKTVGPPEIMAAYGAGHRDFGENRSHELVAKAAVLPDDINWHFVGSLQSRKAKEIATSTAVLHAIDRESVLRAWAKTQSDARLLLQVNIAREEQKHGADPDSVVPLLLLAADLGLSIAGLMLIAPLADEAEDSRRWFRMLRQLRDELRTDWPDLIELSMGMTNDFEVALEEGATLIRVGRAIFGS